MIFYGNDRYPRSFTLGVCTILTYVRNSTMVNTRYGVYKPTIFSVFCNNKDIETLKGQYCKITFPNTLPKFYITSYKGANM